MRLIFTLLLLVASYVVAEDLVLPLCDPRGSWELEFVMNLYRAQPTPARWPYTPDGCRRYFAGEDMRMFWGDDIKGLCYGLCAPQIALCAVIPQACDDRVPKMRVCDSPLVKNERNCCKQVICSVL